MFELFFLGVFCYEIPSTLMQSSIIFFNTLLALECGADSIVSSTLLIVFLENEVVFPLILTHLWGSRMIFQPDFC